MIGNAYGRLYPCTVLNVLMMLTWLSECFRNGHVPGKASNPDLLDGHIEPSVTSDNYLSLRFAVKLILCCTLQPRSNPYGRHIILLHF